MCKQHDMDPWLSEGALANPHDQETEWAYIRAGLVHASPWIA